MTPPGTFDRVYAAIRQRLREGMYRPGERLEPALLSDELNASVTPVRDALHRLTGERLVEAPRHEGFRVPMLTETMLRHLYAWHRDLLLLAVMKQETNRLSDDIMISDAPAGESLLQRQNAVFVTLARMTGNPEYVNAFEAVSERLEPIRRLEQLFLDGTEAETDEIVRALQARDRRALRTSLVRYHRRRERLVPELLAVLSEPKTNAL
ncbi:MAG: GntR family transcriptional regulator [Pseudomonadota bacterium]